MKNTLLLVDGHNLLFRMFYGMPDRYRTASGGRYNAVCGFGNVMAAVVSALSPTHALVLFDTEDCGDRRSLDEAYKANRPDYSGMEPDDVPFTQLPAVCALLDSCGIPRWFARGCEADDLIASYALGAGEDTDVVILSSDRDYWQLIGERIRTALWQAGTLTLTDPAAVRAKFGVDPEQFCDWKCLVGDSSDNIAGVPGVGPKTAAALLSRFGTVEGIYLNIDEIEKPKLRSALLASRERMDLNRRLIRLEASVPPPVPYEALAFTPSFPRSVYALAKTCAERQANG